MQDDKNLASIALSIFNIKGINLNNKVLVIGAGLAGSDCANFLAEAGVKVVLLESKTLTKTPAQKMNTFAELVCTNSLKSKDQNSAHGLLKVEMKSHGSIVLETGYECEVPAGDALAVDREKFSERLTNKLKNHKNIEVVEREAVDPLALKDEYGCDYVVVATGPLTLKGLEDWIVENFGAEDLYFYDAIAPIVDADSLDTSKMYFKDRWNDDTTDASYLNIPLTEPQYYEFIEDLVKADKVPAQNFEDFKFFEACLPIDVMAERGPETLRFSCMKPIGLKMESGEMPYAVIQLRKENLLGSAYNMVGFQNKLKYGEQLRIFRKLPGFENAQFLHLGSVHRNTFMNSRKTLNYDLSSKKFPKLYFAGQITGVEGYTESASMGLYVGHQILRRLKGFEPIKYPIETGFGALINYLMTVETPSPSSINFGLLPTIKLTREQRRGKNKKKVKKELAATKAREVFNDFHKQNFVQ